MFESLINNPEMITFPVLFVGLLIYVMKENSKREEQYRQTIGRLTNALGSLQTIEKKLDLIGKNFIGSEEKNGD